MIRSYDHCLSPTNRSSPTVPIFDRVATDHQEGWLQERNTFSTINFNLHVRLLESRTEIEQFVLWNIREKMIKSRDLRSHLLFLPRKADLCFVGSKFLDALRQEFPNLHHNQVDKLADFLFEKRFLVPVMKFVTSFKGNTVLYRFGTDEAVVQQNLAPERRKVRNLAQEILGTFEIIPSAVTGEILQEIVCKIVGKPSDIAKWDGLSQTATVQLQFLLLHGFIYPDRAGNEEQYQVFRMDCNYSFRELSAKRGAVLDQLTPQVEVTEPRSTLGALEPTTEESGQISRRGSVITTSTLPTLLKPPSRSDSELPGPSNRRISRTRYLSSEVSMKGEDSPNTSPRSTLTPRPESSVQRSQSDRKTTRDNTFATSSTPLRKRSKTLQDLNYAVVEVDEGGNARIVDSRDITPTMKPFEHNYRPLPDNYEILKMIDSGDYSTVYLCRDKPSLGIMAVKQVRYDPRSKKSKKRFDALMNELEILKTLEHDNIVRYYGFNSDQGTFNIFMEYVDGGSMRRFIQMYGPLSNEETIESLAHILLGLSYLHRNFIIHRDLKGANVLISADGSLKIADFGCSKKFKEEDEDRKAFSSVGTPYWMSPEIIKGEGHNNKCDIWAVGATCYELLTGDPPYFHLDPSPAMYRIASEPMKDNLDFGKGITAELKGLILRCLEMDWRCRPTVDEILTLPMFSNHVSRRRCVFYI